MLYTKDRYKLKLKHFTDSIQYTLFKSSSCSSHRNNLSSSGNSSSSDEVKRCSYSRSCSLIKELSLCNDFDFFFTLTLKDFSFRNDIKESISFINKHIKHYGRLARSRGLTFKFIYVFERQKKGGIHLHGYFSGFYDLYRNSNGFLSSLYFDRVGFQNFTVAHEVNPFYLIKYILKDPIKESNHLFYRSKGLKKADVSYLHDDTSFFLNFPFTFENQFCKMITIKK